MKYLAVVSAVSLSLSLTLCTPPGAAVQASPSAIQPGETLDIQVAGEATLSKSYTVDTSGCISVDMLGQVPVTGRTAEQVAAELRTRLGRYLKQPNVSVSANTVAHQEILVTGEAVRPGPVKLRPGDAVLDALGAAGGLGPNADIARITLVRRGQIEPLALNVEQLLKGDLSQNMMLNDGDILQIPRKINGSYELFGEVRQPGTHTLDPPMTVLEALVASGLTDLADRDRVTLKRKDQLDPVTINLEQLIAGDPTANLALQSGDVITVASRVVVGVTGAVLAAGEQRLHNGGTLMEAVSRAGGFGPDADRAEIQITHRDGKQDTCSLADVTGVIGGPELHSGDLVFVKATKPKTVMVTGAVRNPGTVRYKEGMKMTDLLMAAGMQENALWKQVRVLRGEDGPQRKIVVFNLEAYLKAPETANLTLLPDDQIYVEARRQGNGKTVLRRLYDVLPLAGLFFGL
jgi:protein involved in polysaccharide export with SLBB domain